MPTIQSADLWRESRRYDDYGKEMLRIVDRHERDMLFGPTAEEVVTAIFRDSVKSYKDLPKNLYNIQWKFRDEIRPRFGVMRGREFLMKDAYSFDLTADGARHAYNRMFVAYLRTFARHGPEVDPDGGRHRPDRRRSQPRVHHPGRDRREPGLLPQGPDRGRHTRRRTRTSTKTCRRSSSSGRRSYAATEEKHDAGALRDGSAGGQAGVGARHRGRPYFLLRHQVLRADGRQGAGPGRADGHAADGLLRRRRVAARRRHHRGAATTRTASSGRCRWRRSRWR